MVSLSTITADPCGIEAGTTAPTRHAGEVAPDIRDHLAVWSATYDARIRSYIPLGFWYLLPQRWCRGGGPLGPAPEPPLPVLVPPGTADACSAVL